MNLKIERQEHLCRIILHFLKQISHHLTPLSSTRLILILYGIWYMVWSRFPRPESHVTRLLPTSQHTGGPFPTLTPYTLHLIQEITVTRLRVRKKRKVYDITLLADLPQRKGKTCKRNCNKPIRRVLDAHAPSNSSLDQNGLRNCLRDFKVIILKAQINIC
jgi:hypothetical protein